MFTELNEDWEQFSVFMGPAIERVPIMETAEVRHLTVVPESFTPDTAYMLGEAPGVANYFVAAGMNSVGIASAERARARPWPNGSSTAGPPKTCGTWTSAAASAGSATKSTCTTGPWKPWAGCTPTTGPFRQPETARGVRKSVFHDRLASLGACFGVVAGWERPNWFAPDGVEPGSEYSWGRQNWFPYSAAEHMAVRDNVGVYDLSSMAEFLVQGRDAEKVLQRICAGDVAVDPGRVIYTQWLNGDGGVEADVTVTRLDEDRFFIVTHPGANETRDYDWLARRIPDDAHCVLTNINSSLAMLGVMGPRSRDLLSRLTDEDLSNEAFPFATARFMDVAYARPLVLAHEFCGRTGMGTVHPHGIRPERV